MSLSIRRKVGRFTAHTPKKKYALWSGSELAPTYRKIGENYVVLNARPKPLREEFISSHLVLDHLDHLAAQD